MRRKLTEVQLEQLTEALRGLRLSKEQVGTLCRQVARETGFTAAQVRGAMRVAMLRAGKVVLP